MVRVIVLRLGGSVITDRSAERAALNRERLELLAEEILKAQRQSRFQLVITHGMGSYGHPIAKRYGLDIQKMHRRKATGAALLSRALGNLNAQIITLFLKAGLPVMNFPTAHAITDRGKIVHMDTAALPGLLSRGIVPVMQATPVYDLSWGMTILSSDHISPVIAERLGSDLIIAGMSVNGVYDRNPSLHPEARLLPKITPQTLALVKEVGSAQYVDATGGMARTLREAIEATDRNIQTRIVNAALPGVLSGTLLGEPHGTLIAPQ